MAIFTIERPGQLVYFPDSNARVFARSPSGIFYTAYLRWVAGLISVVISRSTDGQVWTIDSELTDPGGSYDYPSLAVDSNNGLHLTAEHIGAGMVYTSKPSGGVWGAEQLIFASWGAAALAIDRNNNIHFVSQRVIAGNMAIVYYQRTVAGWGPEEIISNPPNSQWEPALAIDRSNNIHVVWSGQGWGAFPAREQILHRRRDAAGGWGAITQLTNINNHQWAPQISVDALDNAHIVWTGIAAANTHRLRYCRRLASGVWDPYIEFLLNWVSAFLYQDHSVMIDDTRTYVIYKERDGAGIQQAYHREAINGAAFGAAAQDTAYPADNTVGRLIGAYATHPMVNGHSMSNPMSGAIYVGCKFYGGNDYEIFITGPGTWYSPPVIVNTAPVVMTLASAGVT